MNEVSGFGCQVSAEPLADNGQFDRRGNFLLSEHRLKKLWERFVTAIKIDRIPIFYVRCWTFAVRCSLVFLLIKPAAVLAGGDADS